MLKNYNNFLNKEIITESVSGVEAIKSINLITNKLKKSLKTVKYEYYSNYSNDKSQLKVGDSFFTIMRYEPKNITEENKVLKDNIFWVKIQLTNETPTIINDGKEIEIIVYDYKILRIGDSMIDSKTILESDMENINLILNNSDQLLTKVNPTLTENKIYGFYLFKTEINIEEAFHKHLLIRTGAYSGEFKYDEGKTSTVKKITPKNMFLSFYGLKKNLKNQVVNLDFRDNKYICYDLTTNEIIEIENFNRNYNIMKDSTGNTYTLLTDVKNKILELQKETDFNKKIDIIKRYMKILKISYDKTNDNGSKNNIMILIQNILNAYQKVLNDILLKKKTDIKNIEIYNKIIEDSNSYVTELIEQFKSEETITKILNSIKLVLQPIQSAPTAPAATQAAPTAQAAQGSNGSQPVK